MCGRFYIDEETYLDIRNVVSEVDASLKRMHVTGDIHPTETAPVIVSNDFKNLQLCSKAWGYPGWQKKGVIFNARVESVMEKRMFQNGIHYHRAVIPAAGFYEWSRQKEKNTFYRKDGKPLYLAGFYDRFDKEERFVILTTVANASMRPVHDRMPLVLEKDQIRSWLWEEKQAQGMLRQIPVLLERYVPYEQQNLFE